MKALAAGMAALIVAPVLLIAAAVGGVHGLPGMGAGSVTAALDDIPPDMLGHYTEGAARFAVPFGLLAAVGKVECDHNRNPACARPNHAGAEGPMQFLPGTWAAHQHASGNPQPNVYDPRDAVLAAAHKLAADGAADRPADALYSYNPSRAYVATVAAWALAYGWAPPDPAMLADALAHHPNVTLRPAAADDLTHGLADPRLVAALLILATRFQLDHVGPLVSGHSYYVAGTSRPSNHAFGRAADLPAINGEPVTPFNGAARAAAELLLTLPAPYRPDELGSPWHDLTAYPGAFADQAHQDHLHAGFHNASPATPDVPTDGGS